MELQRYQSDIEYFKEHDTEVFAISVDAAPSQKKFAEELGASFRFLADFPERKVSQLYGVLSERGFANRVTFLVDKQGIIQRIDTGRDALEIEGLKSDCSRLK